MNYSAKNSISLNSGLVQIIFGVGLLFLCSEHSIPLKPVPITLQTVGVMIIALCYNKTNAMKTIIAYVSLGALGVPVFVAYRSGLSVLFGANGGYYFGFILCVYVIAILREKFGEKSWYHLVAYSLLGTCSVFLIGLPWLGYFIGPQKAIEFGLLPFIIPGCLKAFVTVAAVRAFKTKLSN